MNTVPPTSELFPQDEFVERHPTLMNKWRVQWAVRHRHKNGLADADAVFESKGGEVLIHEPAFLRWFLGLSGRAKPRAARRKRRLRKGRSA
jgi:hypothetical protein